MGRSATEACRGGRGSLLAPATLRLLRRTITVRSGSIASFRARRDRGLTPTTGPALRVHSPPGHVWTAPGWQEFSSRKEQWSEQPCVRPVSAVHVTAGHNALRGSGPGQFHAFDHAVARVGCPDRRIDRLCITCCSPFPTVTSRRMPDAISFTPRVRRVPCSARPWSSLPKPFGPSCWQARWQQPWWAAAPTTP